MAFEAMGYHSPYVNANLNPQGSLVHTHMSLLIYANIDMLQCRRNSSVGARVKIHMVNAVLTWCHMGKNAILNHQQ